MKIQLAAGVIMCGGIGHLAIIFAIYYKIKDKK